MVAEELAKWSARHSDEPPHEDAPLRPSVRAAGEISFILFRNQPDVVPEYDVGDKASFDLELREVRRSASAPGYSLVWRACGFRMHEPDASAGGEGDCPDESAGGEGDCPDESAGSEGDCPDESAGGEVCGPDESAGGEVGGPGASALSQLASQVHNMRREMDAIAGRLESLACHSSR